MKRVIMICMLAVIAFAGHAQTQKGQSSAGLMLGYGFDSENMLISLDYRYSLTDAVRLGPSLTHYVKNNGLNAWAIDLNANYLVKLNEFFGFYPIAGANLTFWHFDAFAGFSDNDTRIGANIGLGGEIYATENISIGLEVKYQLMKDFDQAMFGVRAAYLF